MLVVFEGIDAVGKSTQISLLKAHFKDAAITSCEPGGTEFGQNLRNLILNSSFSISKTAEMFLFLADRAEHYEKITLQNRDKFILCDRGFVSGIAYAMTNDANLGFDELVNLNKIALNGDFEAKFIFFKIDEKNLISRLNSRKNHDNIEKRGISYLMEVQKNMEFTIDKLGLNVLKIDATSKIDDIFAQIKEFIA